MSELAAEWASSGRLATHERGRPSVPPAIRRGPEMTMVRRMLAGDESAFDEFADVYLPRLHRFAMNRLDRDTELAREIVQATVVKAIAKLESFRGEAALMTWLCACCRTEIAMHFRREGRGGGADVEFDERSGPASSQWGGEPLGAPEEAALRGEAMRRVHEALDQLPPHYGRALEWKYLDELPVKEIAARLNLGPKAAESLLTRARNAFREIYSQAGAGSVAEPMGRDGALT